MRQENYRNKMKVNRMTTALLGIFFYIILVLILKTIQNGISIGSTGMKIFNIIEFAVIVVYLVLYTWLNFKDATQETGGSFGKYLLFSMIPLLVMTLLTIVLSYAGTNGSFGSNWNAVTFIIGPTLFCYIPFGIVLQFAGNMPMVLFYIAALALMVLFQYLGFIIGSGSRKFARERELVRAEQSRRSMQRQDEMAKQAVQQQRQRATRQTAVRRQTIVDENDPLKDIESTPIIETEAFTTITDEMIEEAIRQKKIRTSPERARRASAVRNQREAVNTGDNEALKRQAISDMKQKNQQIRHQSDAGQEKADLQSRQNLQKELEILRKRLASEENKKK